MITAKLSVEKIREDFPSALFFSKKKSVEIVSRRHETSLHLSIDER